VTSWLKITPPSSIPSIWLGSPELALTSTRTLACEIQDQVLVASSILIGTPIIPAKALIALFPHNLKLSLGKRIHMGIDVSISLSVFILDVSFS